MIPPNNDSFENSYCRSKYNINNGRGNVTDYVKVNGVKVYAYTTVGCDLLKESFNVLGEQVQNGLRSGYEAAGEYAGALSYGFCGFAEDAAKSVAKAPEAFKNVGDGVEEAACNVWRSLNMCGDKSRTDGKPTGGGVADRGTTGRRTTGRRTTGRRTTGRRTTNSSHRSAASTVRLRDPRSSSSTPLTANEYFDKHLIGKINMSVQVPDSGGVRGYLYTPDNTVMASQSMASTLNHTIKLLELLGKNTNQSKEFQNLKTLFENWSKSKAAENKTTERELWGLLKDQFNVFGVEIKGCDRQGNKKSVFRKGQQSDFYKIRFQEKLAKEAFFQV